MSNAITNIHSLTVHSLRSKKSYILGEMFNYQDAKGNIIDSIIIDKILEHTKQVGTHELILVYHILDQHGNLITELAANIPGLEITCKHR